MHRCPPGGIAPVNATTVPPVSAGTPRIALLGAPRKFRFLRGPRIDDAKIPALDTVISFDGAQDEVFWRPAPLIVVGSGGGKMALTIEKLKSVEGEVLYVTRSAYLAQNARGLYFHEGLEAERQDATFLSYREFVESLRVPERREVQWRDFAPWLDDFGLCDPGLVAWRWRKLATPRYDFVVIDEVQDLTSSQLALVLATLKKP